MRRQKMLVGAVLALLLGASTIGAVLPAAGFSGGHDGPPRRHHRHHKAHPRPKPCRHHCDPATTTTTTTTGSTTSQPTSTTTGSTTTTEPTTTTTRPTTTTTTEPTTTTTRPTTTTTEPTTTTTRPTTTTTEPTTTTTTQALPVPNLTFDTIFWGTPDNPSGPPRVSLQWSWSDPAQTGRAVSVYQDGVLVLRFNPFATFGWTFTVEPGRTYTFVAAGMFDYTCGPGNSCSGGFEGPRSEPLTVVVPAGPPTTP